MWFVTRSEFARKDMWSIFVFNLLLLSVYGQTTDPPTVTISQGTVTGIVSEDGHYEFHGIPYADSTSGTHRFKAPSAPPSFEQNFVANRRNIKCVHAISTGYEGTEDCLVVDVYTPSLDTDESLPVMVWVKGKEFDRVYERELSFKNFIEKDVIIVSLNYRESILGFLCLGTETAPGNAGLKDIIAGLNWIQDNIAQFGGSPQNVTLVGHGSGAAAVDLVTLSPMASNLIHKVIVQSGTALAPWAVSRDNLKYAVDVAEALGHTITNIQELSDVFTRVSVSALMAVITDLDLTDNALAFAPCVERDDLEGVEPFLVKTPFQSIIEGDFLQIPFLTGFVDNEGTIRAEEALERDWLERMDTSFVDFLQPDLRIEDEDVKLQTAQSIRSFYFGDEEISLSNIDDFISYHGDTMILVSAIREANMRANLSTEPIYLYQFSYKGSLGAPFVGPLEVDSAAHSEELAYLFYNESEDNNVMDLTVADMLIERWTNFAKTGVPTSDTSPSEWQPYTSINSNFLHFVDADENSTFEATLQNPHPSTMMFWNDIYQLYFLDAESNWIVSERDEDDEDVAEGDGSEDNEDDNTEDNEDTDNGGNGEDDDEDDEDDDDNDEGESDSASTAVAYTFTIVTLFAILDKFHSSQLGF